ncbi:FGGY-family carbohydrate kinase [Arthrobacter sp. 92]|uniref:FGGY-family carbohydrate kinase n=1 Tax=Arthrobacter sp. 92 TaxID=3418175 RepID=UPI003D02A5A9
MRATLGVDIGTSSSKGVLVGPDGRILRSAQRTHEVMRPHPGWVEMDPDIWWSEFCDIAAELVAPGDAEVAAIGVSGMGPCVVIADDEGNALRPAILYGVDTRASEEIAELTERYGQEEILERGGSALSSQAVGPKLAWLARHEPELMASARRLFMPSSWLAFRLTGAYALDRHSASQCSPLFDRHTLEWHRPWAEDIAPGIGLPKLCWPGNIVGTTRGDVDGLPAGIPVIAGTIDAWTEALSIGAQNDGDLMLMYGTTMFLVATVDSPVTAPGMWGTVGALEGTRNLAGGLATSGAITSWLRGLTSTDYPQLLAEAEASGPGANGLLMLPYFAGERTPIMDPDARGLIAGLTLSHTRGDIYRATLEATALAVRHNIEVMREAGVDPQRILAVGGGTQGGLWTRIVSDITGLPQLIPSTTIGASYGAAWLAADALAPVDISVWNPPAAIIEPDPDLADAYDELYDLYRGLQPAVSEVSHALARRQHRTNNK